MPQTPDHVRDNLPVWIAPSRTALCVIDIQVDFAAPDGLMASFGADLASVPAAVEKAGALVSSARSAGVQVVFVGLRTSPETDSDVWRTRMRRQGDDPDTGSAVCRAGTYGAEFFGPQPAASDMVFYKRKYSGFYETDLDAGLRQLGIDTLAVCGLTTECCVESTVRDAFHRDFSVFVVTDATAAYDQRLHESSLEAMDVNFAIMAEATDVLAAWKLHVDRASSSAEARHV